MFIFQMALVIFCTLTKMALTEIGLRLQHINIPQMLEKALKFFLVQTMQRNETKAFYLSLN